MANELDVNQMTDTAVTNAGKYLVYNIFVAIGAIIGLIILVALVVLILDRFGLRGVVRMKK